MKARDVMCQPVLSVREDCTLEEAAKTMLARKIGCLPVVDAKGDLVGIVTESDFSAKAKGVPFSLYKFPQLFGEWMPDEGVEEMYQLARTKPVKESMSRSVATVAVDAELETVIRTMLKSGFHRLPVVEGGKPVGVIARHDLLRLMLEREPKS